MTNNADNKSALNWLNDITDEFMLGQCFVVMVPDSKGAIMALEAFQRILTAPTVVFYITSRRIEETHNHGVIRILTADMQHDLRGIRRDYKLVDPNGYATPEMRNRFR